MDWLASLPDQLVDFLEHHHCNNRHNRHNRHHAHHQVLASLICQTVGGLLGAGMIDRQGRKPVLQAGAGVRFIKF